MYGPESWASVMATPGVEGPFVELGEVMKTRHGETAEHLVLIKSRKISQAKCHRPTVGETLRLCGHNKQQESAL